MLVRTVRMYFLPGSGEEFLKLFDRSKNKIRNFPGCHHLELWQDYHDQDIYVTYSYWEDDGALQAYRKSELFKTVWAETKKLFEKDPVAFSSRVSTVVKPG